MKNKKGLILIRMGVLLILAAIILTGYNLVEGYMAGQAADQAMQFLYPMIEGAEPTAAPLVVSGGQAAPDVPVLVPPTESEGVQSRPQPTQEPAPMATPSVEIPDYVLNPKMEMPVVNYDGYDYIGVLEIPMLGLRLPIISQWSYPGLKIAPCRYVGSAYTNNMVISAHNYQRHFGRINELRPGNTVLFTDVDGNVFKYEVVLKETLAPNDVDSMKYADFDLTLFTCTVGGSHRVTVRCDLLYGYGYGPTAVQVN